jgi:hypothetical protein
MECFGVLEENLKGIKIDLPRLLFVDSKPGLKLACIELWSLLLRMYKLVVSSSRNGHESLALLKLKAGHINPLKAQDGCCTNISSAKANIIRERL